MSQFFTAQMTIHEIKHFDKRGELEELTVLKGYTTGLDSLFIDVEVKGPNAAHCFSYLKKGSKVAIQGVWQAKKKEQGTFYSVLAKAPVEFLSGTKNDIERLSMPDPSEFKTAKEAKDYAATVLIPLGINFLPIHPFSYIAKIIESHDAEMYSSVIGWMTKMSEQFDTK